MIRFYTGETAKAFVEINADIKFPENGLSPWEQIEWIKENWSRDIIVLTFSPYIMNYLNVLIAECKLNEDNFEAWYMYIDEDKIVGSMNIKVHNEKGELIVDTFDLAEPMTEIYRKYIELRN